MSNKKRQAEKKGRRGELFAAFALLCKGYSIKAMRFKTKQGEVDIIARKGDLILLVEVKARKTLADAHNAISANSAKRIEAAGDIWLSRQKDYQTLSLRRDLIAILPRKWPQHIPNAF